MADIHCHCDDTFRAITDRFAINLDILAVKMASWHDVDNAMALLAMKSCKDDANTQGYLDGCAARALQNAAARVNVLAASRRQEDDAHAKALPLRPTKGLVGRLPSVPPNFNTWPNSASRPPASSSPG